MCRHIRLLEPKTHLWILLSSKIFLQWTTIRHCTAQVFSLPPPRLLVRPAQKAVGRLLPIDEAVSGSANSCQTSYTAKLDDEMLAVMRSDPGVDWLSVMFVLRKTGEDHCEVVLCLTTQMST
jgi:hypothetical protein